MLTRVDELRKTYPNLPREVLVKLDALTLGIRHSKAFDKVGHLTRRWTIIARSNR